MRRKRIKSPFLRFVRDVWRIGQGIIITLFVLVMVAVFFTGAKFNVSLSYDVASAKEDLTKQVNPTLIDKALELAKKLY